MFRHRRQTSKGALWAVGLDYPTGKWGSESTAYAFGTGQVLNICLRKCAELN